MNPKETKHREEMKRLLETIRAAYPGFYKGENLSVATDCWCSMFVDDDIRLVAIAIKSYITTDEKGFPPVIGQIKTIMAKLLNHETMTEVEAWTLIKRAIRNSAYNSVEEHSKLPELLQKIVSPDQLKDWALADIGDESVTASNFMRSYRVKLKRAEEIKALPNDVKSLLGQFHGKMLE